MLTTTQEQAFAGPLTGGATVWCRNGTQVRAALPAVDRNGPPARVRGFSQPPEQSRLRYPPLEWS